jgi:hypothetical protein
MDITGSVIISVTVNGTFQHLCSINGSHYPLFLAGAGEAMCLCQLKWDNIKPLCGSHVGEIKLKENTLSCDIKGK